MVTMVDEPLLTVKEVAARLRVSEWAVTNWLRTGELKGWRLGGKRAGWRIRESEFRRFVEERESRGAPKVTPPVHETEQGE